MKNIFLYIALCSMTACVGLPAQFSNVNITTQGSDKPNSLCHNFKLTNQEAQAFFTLAKEVSAIEIHNQYDYLPCYIKGTVAYTNPPKNPTCDFVIRAGGTAELACKGEEIRLYGCSICGNLLKN